MAAAPDSFTSSVRAIPHRPQSSGSQDRHGSVVWMVQVGQPWFAHRDPALLESREEDLLCPRLRSLSRGQRRCTNTTLACPTSWQRGAWLTGVVEVQQQGLVPVYSSCFWEHLGTCSKGPGETQGTIVVARTSHGSGASYWELWWLGGLTTSSRKTQRSAPVQSLPCGHGRAGPARLVTVPHSPAAR